MVLPEDSRPYPGKLLDLLILTLPGERERTEPEWRVLLEKTGFTLTQVIPTKVAESVIEVAIIYNVRHELGGA